MLKKLVSCVLICSLICLSFCSCSSNQREQGDKNSLNKYSASYIEYFDTFCTVVGYEETKEEFDKVAKNIEEQLAEYNRLYDIYKAYDGVNNIYTINKNAGKEPVKVDSKIIDLIDYSGQLFELTDGTVNIAMGSVLSIWHDYRNRYADDTENAKLPDINILKSASNHTDFTKVMIDREKSTVYLSDSQMSLDVGSVAKGYATEQIAKSLIANGVKNYALNFGGNIRTIGTKGDGTVWKAAVTNPNKQSEKPYLMSVKLTDQTFVTSGSYERFYTVDGVRYHHIIDPNTLMPNNTFTSVSILAEDSALADVLSTALFNMTYDEGKRLIDGIKDTEALWVTANGELLYSNNFKDSVSEYY